MEPNERPGRGYGKVPSDGPDRFDLLPDPRKVPIPEKISNLFLFEFVNEIPVFGNEPIAEPQVKPQILGLGSDFEKLFLDVMSKEQLPLGLFIFFPFRKKTEIHDSGI